MSETWHLGSFMVLPWQDEPLFVRTFEDPTAVMKVLRPVMFDNLLLDWDGTSPPPLAVTSQIETLERREWRWGHVSVFVYAAEGDYRADEALALLCLASRIIDRIAEVARTMSRIPRGA